MASNRLQEGVYVTSQKTLGNSFALVCLKLQPHASAETLHEFILAIWRMLNELKNGEVRELGGGTAVHKYSDNLSVMIAFGHSIFDFMSTRGNKKMNKSKPSSLSERWMFEMPSIDGGGKILNGSGLFYSQDVKTNHAISDEVVLQFVSDSQFGSNRAVVEVAKVLWNFSNLGKEVAQINRVYSGFLRQDKRGWLGFHEGVSNLQSSKRFETVVIKEKFLENREDYWTDGGTYMAFLRMDIDLRAWQTIPRNQQEIIVGRDKLTGCPIIGIDNNRVPIKDHRCPVPGTLEVTDERNEYFREIPDYGNQRLSLGATDEQLQYSHIARVRNRKNISPALSDSLRIYRQGFEFLELSDNPPYFRTGLNFISFQDHPSRIINLLTSPHWLGGSNFGGDSRHPIESLRNFVTIRAAGIFFVPPVRTDETFPGESMFW